MIAVRRAGLAAVTDLGRPGLARQGIPAGGAADQYSAAVANILVGNAEDGPLIEVTASDFVFTAAHAALVAVTGAPATVTVGRWPVRTWEPICVGQRETVSITAIHSGLRVYVAVNGRWQVPHVFGSCAPNAQLGVGTWLRGGDSVEVRSDYRPIDHPVLRHPVFSFGARPPRFGSPYTIEVTTGPDSADVSAAVETLESAEYTVRPESDHVGLRLAGPVPSRRAAAEVLSKGVPAGAVEVPPAPELLVLQRGRPVTAGYPVVAVATRVAQSTLGQVGPGQTIRFRHRTVDEAVQAQRRQRRSLDELVGRARTAFASVGIPYGIRKTLISETRTEGMGL